jgi:hypothetical protein
MSGSRGRGLTRRHEAGIAALLETGTIEGAAKKVGVSERTLRRWLDDPAFAGAYRRARAEVLGFALGALQRAVADAEDTLKKAMKGKGTAVQVSAARAVIEHALRSVEVSDVGELAARLAALEQKQADDTARAAGEEPAGPCQ